MELVRTCQGKLFLDWSGPHLLQHQSFVDVPPGLAGVYALMAFSPICPRYVVYYVGQSDDIARRLDEHTRSPKAILLRLHNNLRTYFAAARVMHPVARTAVEAALIKLLNPVGNDRVPDAPAVTVNPPPTNLLPL